MKSKVTLEGFLKEIQCLEVDLLYVRQNIKEHFENDLLSSLESASEEIHNVAVHVESLKQNIYGLLEEAKAED